MGGRPAADWGRPARLSLRVPRPGVYALNVTVSNDRYGEAMVWGFTTNCSRYLIGDHEHQDESTEAARIRQPFAAGGRRPPPPRRVLRGESGLPKDVERTHLARRGRPAAGGECPSTRRAGPATRTQQPRGRGRAMAAALPVQRATVQIDGLTRWDSATRLPPHALWTTHVEAWFPLASSTASCDPLSPQCVRRRRTRGEVKVQAFHNSSEGHQVIELACEFPDAEWPASVVPRVELPAAGAPRGRRPLHAARRRANGGAVAANAVAARLSTCRSVNCDAAGPASQPLQLPLVLQPSRPRNQQFGYLPELSPSEPVLFHLAEAAAGLDRPRHRPPGGPGLVDGGAGRRGAAGGPAQAGGVVPASLSKRCAPTIRAASTPWQRAGGRRSCYADRRRTDVHRHVGPRPRIGVAELDFEEFTGHNGLAGPPPNSAVYANGGGPETVLAADPRPGADPAGGGRTAGSRWANRWW